MFAEATLPPPPPEERTPFTPDEVDRLWCALFPAELECEKRWSPAKRARLDQLRAEFRETL